MSEPAAVGSCLCGGVRFEVAEEFDAVGYCHCASCKKISGAGGTVSGIVQSDAIRILAGEELLQRYQPDDGSAKTFCSVCGANLFGAGWPESEHAAVRISALDSPFDRRPERHIFVRSVAPWEVLPEDGTPRYDVRPT